MTTVAAKIREKPILFRDEMVQAILEGRKVMTRRIVKPQPEPTLHGFRFPGRGIKIRGEKNSHILLDNEKSQKWIYECCPYGSVGDRLWVRECFQSDDRGRVAYRASPETWPSADKITDGTGWINWHWRPSIFMSKYLSRITLEITSVRVERLHSITEADAISEGVSYTGPYPGAVAAGFLPRAEDLARREFRKLWQSIHGDGAWAANPWLWVISFRRIKP